MTQICTRSKQWGVAINQPTLGLLGEIGNLRQLIFARYSHSLVLAHWAFFQLSKLPASSLELFSHGLLNEEQNSSLRNKGRNQPPLHGSVICKVTKCLWVKCMLLIRSLKNWVSPASRFLEKSQSLTLQLSGWKQENSQSSCSQGSLGTGAISLPTQVWPPQLQMKVNKLDLCCRLYRFLFRREPLPSWTLSAQWK